MIIENTVSRYFDASNKSRRHHQPPLSLTLESDVYCLTTTHIVPFVSILIMVLENSYNHVNDNGFNDEPISDVDPYDTPKSSNTTIQYRIDFTNLPKPIPFIGNLIGYENKFKREAYLKMTMASSELHRPLNQDEVDAFAYWMAKRHAITSWGAPIGFACGIWRSYNTAGTLKFPFWRSSTNFLNMNAFGPLKGPSAVLFIHSMRYLAYGLTGNTIGKFLFGSYAMSSAAVGASNDPRLQEYMNAIEERLRRLSKNVNVSQNPATRLSSKTPRTLEEPFDDASPSSLNETFPYGSRIGVEKDSSNIANPDVERNSWTTAKPGLPSTQNIERSWFNDFDSSSHTENPRITHTNMASSGTSVWDKIRGGQHVSKSETQRNPKHIPSSTRKLDRNESPHDSFSYSKHEEESAYAKDESLNNFDAQIERERRGGATS
ncbi:putative endo-beta-glucanase [Golovinomyces cichoracearum]|uniref:Putative endo-beta-glucanase n=1 Tax=Golovinomyces cichoracearum TaxID=62708 RepID=A0A420I9J5_9PEZI|nr:putative endo-beta-glucanase [Golovinomyces cichoracearum]